ncbi:MAG: hypothetical protein M1818_004092 [Claussenomyces sp. TS43310]|nr:MAG: hypothetical protein M1818_004092 [Claussenomyces sp. TS43310]
MATTAVMNPTSIFQSHPPSHPPPPYSHHNLTPSLAHPLSALISPSLHSADSRRSLGEDPKGPASQRQSLPSIHEALADAPATYSPYTTSASQYTPAYAPAATTPTRRSFPSDSSQYPPQSNSANPPHRNSPPQPVQPSPSSFPRNEPASRIYPDPLRQPATLRAALPPQTRSNSLSRTPVPRPGSEPHYYDPTGSSNGYGPPPAADQYRAYPPAAPPASNIYTAHSSHDVPYQQRYPSGPENAEELGAKKGESGHMRQGFASVLKRNLDYWDEERSMRELNNSAQRLAQISSDYLAVAQRWGNTPHRGNAALVDLENLRAEHMKIGHCIEQVQTSIEEQEAFVADQQSREQMGKSAMNYDRDDFDAWSGDSKDQGLGGPGPNKRRGVGSRSS